MVQLIPDFISNDIKSDAEKKLFQEFREVNSSDNFIVLHSLAMAEHVNNIFGEIDFVIICRKGFLCVEVKGGGVDRKDGIWHFTNRYGKIEEKEEGPFAQVQGNMLSLMKYLKKRLGKYDAIARCQYACCVVMPDCTFDYQGTDIINEILFDKESYRGFLQLIDPAFQYWSDRCYSQHGFRGGELSNEDIERAANILRGDFRFVPPMKDIISKSTKELCSLTNEQYEVIESLSDNPRTLVSGVAGSGKTWLAMEQARRWYWEGKKVLYLCFNRNISEFVKYQFDKDNLSIEVSTFHSKLMNDCNIVAYDSYDTEFFVYELPDLFNSRQQAKYDVLVIDEGQDLLKPQYIKCMSNLITGGLENGMWLYFYDPNQNIYNNDDELETCISVMKRHGASFRLSVNCRNTQEIADANALMTGFINQGKAKVHGLSVEYNAYAGKKDEQMILIENIQKLLDEGLTGCDIVILSKYNVDNVKSCLNNLIFPKSLGKIKAAGQMWKAKPNEFRVATISSFKGLESHAVILTDIDCFSEQDVRLLNYVGISRAQSLLYVLYSKDAEAERQKMIVERFSNAAHSS